MQSSENKAKHICANVNDIRDCATIWLGHRTWSGANDHGFPIGLCGSLGDFATAALISLDARHLIHLAFPRHSNNCMQNNTGVWHDCRLCAYSSLYADHNSFSRIKMWYDLSPGTHYNLLGSQTCNTKSLGLEVHCSSATPSTIYILIISCNIHAEKNKILEVQALRDV